MSYTGELKVKLLVLWEMLRKESDLYRPMTTNEILRGLQEKGIPCDRRTIVRDIKLLNDFGFEVMEAKVGKQNGYYVDDRRFNLAELKILLDAIQAASFITEKKTQELIEKVSFLGGIHKAELLQSNLVHFNTRKHTNEQVYISVDAIEKALLSKSKVSFIYFDLNENHERVYRKDKQEYIVDPVSLVFINDNYYLMCYSDAYEKIVSYRVDRMQMVKKLESPVCAAALIPEEQIAAYTEQTFKMFSGEPETVTLHFDNSLIGVVYDKFGEDTKMLRVDDDTCIAQVTVQISPTFWGWLFQFAGEMRITEPGYLIDTYKHLLDTACE